jgi:hypothetical protein
LVASRWAEQAKHWRRSQPEDRRVSSERCAVSIAPWPCEGEQGSLDRGAVCRSCARAWKYAWRSRRLLNRGEVLRPPTSAWRQAGDQGSESKAETFRGVKGWALQDSNPTGYQKIPVILASSASAIAFGDKLATNASERREALRRPSARSSLTCGTRSVEGALKSVGGVSFPFWWTVES